MTSKTVENLDHICRNVTSKLAMEVEKPLPPGLYVVATPIGNLADMTLRALATLSAVDVIYCEDTRHSGHLMSQFGLKTPLRRYDDHTNDTVRQDILRQLEAGSRIALISDAGTPLISDPGFKLVQSVRNAGFALTGVPGPSAAITALSLSGLPTQPFLFEGFLPNRTEARKKRISALKEVPATLIFYESPQRATSCLADLADVLGDRPGCVARELTKRFEEIITAPLPELFELLNGREKLKGEFVILTGPPPAKEVPDDAIILKALELELESVSFRDAVRLTAERFDLPRNHVYKLGLSMK